MSEAKAVLLLLQQALIDELEEDPDIGLQNDLTGVVEVLGHTFEVSLVDRRVRFEGKVPALFALVPWEDRHEQVAVVRRWLSRVRTMRPAPYQVKTAGAGDW